MVDDFEKKVNDRVAERAAANSAANGAAAENLASAEATASGGLFHHGDSLDGAREGEARTGGFYSGGGSVGKMAQAAGDIRKGNFKGAFRKAGPIGAIFLVVFIVGGIMAGTQVFQPFALVAQFQESFNSMHVSAYSRSARMIRYQLNSGRLKNPVKGTIFGGQKFALSQKQIEQYAKQGITYNDQYDGPDGRKIRVLEYDTDGGQHRIVTADADTAARLRANGTPALSIDAAYQDTSFFHKFTVAAQTWRGQFANWFGKVTNNFLEENKLTRNLWKDYKQKAAEAEASGKTRLEVVKEMIKSKVNEGDSGGVARKTTTEDDDGKTRINDGLEVTNGSKTDSGQVRAKLDDIKSRFKTGTGGIANIGCAVADFVGVVNLAVVAEEAAQIMSITTSYMEAIDKTKAGYGEEAPINELANTLNEQVTTSHLKIVPGDGGSVSEDGETKKLTATTEDVKGSAKSAMQAAGMAALFGNGLTDPNDASVQSFNLTSSANTLLSGVGVSMSSFRDCTVARAAEAVANIGLCALTAGAACAADFLKSLAVGVTVGLTIRGIIEVLTPWLTSVLGRDLVSTLAGEDLGNALVSGANMYQGYVHKTNGGSLSTRGKYEQFAATQQQVIAEEAKEERATLSPFDMTSKNTFMGSIMTQLMALNTSSSIMGTLTSASSVVSSSVMSASSSASAIAAQIAETLPTEEEYAQICPYLAEIGAIGDSFCNPYMVTDMDTMDYDPADVIEAISGQFEDTETGDGNVKIKKDSDLMKYIVYCGERISPFGVADQGIISNIKTSTGSPVVDTVIGAAPIVGDVVDLFDAEKVSSGIGYISGESCVAGNNLGEESFAKSSPNWNTAKYYQRFIEDQSLAESMGVIEKSAVATALEDYYKENPLDESYEGQLARRSGLDKETISDMLDIIAYYNYIDAYDASERYAFGGPAVDDGDKVIDLENENVMNGMSVALEGVVYADIRNRTFAV